MNNPKDIGFQPDSEQQTMSDGTLTRALYIKHLSLADWEIITECKHNMAMKSDADVIRWALRKAGGRI